jgi:hypothetical protein
VGGRKEDGMVTQAPGGFDFEVLRRAIEGRDAEVLTVNRTSTPSSPEIEGVLRRS